MDLDEKKRRIERRAQIREFVFGIQDGLISTVGLVGGIQGATSNNNLVILAGLAAMAAGAISMGSGSYLSSKAAKEVIEQEIREEASVMQKEPYLAQEELLGTLTQDGLSREEAYRITQILRRREDLFFKTFQEKVLGISKVEIGQPLRGALVMAFSYSIGAFVPLVPYFFLEGEVAFYATTLVSALTLFGVGALKGWMAGRSLVLSGLEFFGVALGAAGLGYFIGTVINYF